MNIGVNENSILNPDVVKSWAISEVNAYGPDRAKRMIADRSKRATSLLPNVKRYVPNCYDRAVLAASMWDFVLKTI